jgi:XTP/dITP diphosphohydrolase
MRDGDLAALREELGDVLLQVVLHARLAEDLPEDERWSVDDVAGGLVDKMVRRNPHVFAGETVDGVEAIIENWERIKKAEKSRDSVLDGVALSQPALSLAAQILQRTERAGLDVPLPAGADLGPELLRAVAGAQAEGRDAEAELRQAVLTYADEVRTAELSAGGSSAGGSSAGGSSAGGSSTGLSIGPSPTGGLSTGALSGGGLSTGGADIGESVAGTE